MPLCAQEESVDESAGGRRPAWPHWQQRASGSQPAERMKCDVCGCKLLGCTPCMRANNVREDVAVFCITETCYTCPSLKMEGSFA